MIHTTVPKSACRAVSYPVARGPDPPSIDGWLARRASASRSGFLTLLIIGGLVAPGAARPSLAQEAWTGTMTGTGAPLTDYLMSCEPGQWSTSYELSFTVSSSLVDFLLNGGPTPDGSGNFSGSETVAQQSASPASCTLQPSSVSNVPISLIPGPVAGELLFEAAEPIFFERITLSGFELTNPRREFTLHPTSISSTVITGTWTSATGTFQGTFTLTSGAGCSVVVERLGQCRLADGTPASWAGARYDNAPYPPGTICKWGCALTSLTMGLNVAEKLDGVGPGLHSPLDVNASMIQHGDYVGRPVGNVFWGPAVRHLSGGRLAFHFVKTVAEMDQALCQGFSVIVGVKLRSGGKPGHFVLVTGKQGAQYRIADPSDPTNGQKTLDAYGSAFALRGYVGGLAAARLIADSSELNLGVDDTVQMMVTDDAGRRTGFDPSTGQIVQEIPNSIYVGDSLEDDETGAPPTNGAQILRIARPTRGRYRILVTGVSSGSYTIVLRGFAADGGAQPDIVFQGTAAPGSTAFFEFEFDPTPPPLSLVVRGTDNAIYHSRSSGTTWSGWIPLPGATADIPALAASGDGRLDLVVRGIDNGIYHNHFDGTTWSGWTPLPGATADIPALAASGGGRLDLVVRGTDDSIYHNHFDGTTWSGWIPLPGATADIPALAASGGGRLDLVVRGTDNGVYHNHFNGAAWSGWTALPGTTASRPAIVAE